MPTNREQKPSWSDVPARLVADLEDLLHSRVSESNIIWSGYGPSATFAIRTESGRGYFCKGTHPGYTEEGAKAIRREQGVYEAFPELQRFAPAYHGSVADGAWRLLVFDQIENLTCVPPWTNNAFSQVITTVARFHASMPANAPSVLKSLDTIFAPNLCEVQSGWKSLAQNPSQRENFLSLFADQRAASHWFEKHIASFVDLESKALQLGGPSSWIHQDIRSDNILFRSEDSPLLVDWPYLSYGPVLIDIAFFLPSVCGEGGITPAVGLKHYEQESGVRFSDQDIQVAVATVAGFFAARAGEPDIPGLPRLRSVQRLQLFPSLAWLSEVTYSTRPPPSRDS